jgi:hypothetical protein
MAARTGLAQEEGDVPDALDSLHAGRRYLAQIRICAADVSRAFKRRHTGRLCSAGDAEAVQNLAEATIYLLDSQFMLELRA